MKTVRDLPAMTPRKFAFAHEGESVEWLWTPLTAERVEAARAAFPAPKPPLKDVSDSAKELMSRKSKGLPTQYEDHLDPEFLAATKRRTDDVALEMARLALGWEMERDEFFQLMRSRLPYGVVDALVQDVMAASFNLDFAAVERNLDPSSPSTGTGGGSSTPTAP